MKKITLLTVFLTFFILINKSCKKDIQELKHETSNKISVENGRLKFENENEFVSLFNQFLNSKTDENMILWEKKQKEFTSMKTAFSKLTEKDFENMANENSLKLYRNLVSIDTENDEKVANIAIQHPILARFFNKEGILIIGDDAIYMKNENITRILNYTEEKILKVLNGLKIENSIQTRLIATKLPASFKNLKPNGTLDWSSDCHSLYGGNKAFKAGFTLYGNISLGFNINGVFSHIILVAQHRKQNWLGIWSNYSTDNLTLNANMYVVPSNGGAVSYPGISITQYNSSEISYFYPFSEGWSYVSANVTSSGTVSGNYYGCTASKAL